MRKLLCGTVLTMLALTASLATPPRALAGATECRGAIGAVVVGAIEVPRGATCTLTGTQVQGNIDVERGATLDATGVAVTGNVQSDGHAAVTIDTKSSVSGAIQLRRGGAFTVADTAVDGDIQVAENRGASSLSANTVGDDVHVDGHRGGIAITENRVDGNLQCRRNVPAPTGGGNVVQGNKEGQCRGL